MTKKKMAPIEEMFVAIQTAMWDLTSAVTRDKAAQKKLLKISKPFMSKLSKRIKKVAKRVAKAKGKPVQPAKNDKTRSWDSP